MQQLKVTRVQQEVNEVITVVLEPLSENKLVFKAGQFLTLVFQREGKELRRSYSAYS